MDAIQPSWTPVSKIAFRFFVVYFILYVLPFPFGYFSGVASLWQYYDNPWHAFIPWVGKNILGLSSDITVFPNGGSGDTTYNYVRLLTLAAISLVACVIWSILDRRRNNYSRLSYWSLVAVRYYLAAAMLGYGFAKVFHTQFPFPTLQRLEQPFGESSPMGLLWTFMGYSYGYNLFTGLGEVLGGMLLFFRRTVTAGSLIIVAIMANVVILNFTFDVPVKQYSIHLTIMALILILRDKKRVLAFVLNQTAEPQSNPSDVEWPNLKVRTAIKFASVIYFIASPMMVVNSMRTEIVQVPAVTALQGHYRVKEFSLNGVKEFQLEDTVAWRSLKVYDGLAKMISISDRTITFSVKVDTVKNTFRLSTPDDRYELHYRKVGNEILEAWGPHVNFKLGAKNDTVVIKLTKIPKEHLLLTRGFNWVNEYANNR